MLWYLKSCVYNLVSLSCSYVCKQREKKLFFFFLEGATTVKLDPSQN